MQLVVPGTRTVLTLSINKINDETMMAVVQDITRGIEQETRIRDDQQRFRAIFENVRDYAIVTVDIHGHIDEWNRSLNRLGGWDSADIVGAHAGIFFPHAAAQDSPAIALLDGARQHGTAEFEGWGVRRDGSTFWGNTVATALPDRDGNAIGFVLVTRDLTERKQMEDRLALLATTDPLTGVCNRRGGAPRLEEAFLHWRRYGRTFAVLMIDCDHFKRINDRWGHDTGDDVLRLVVRICTENLRTMDTAIRWGGEEFVLLLPETSTGDAHTVAERMRRAVEAARTEPNGRAIAVTISIGVAEVAAIDTKATDVVLRADHALFAAKRDGRNRVVTDPSA
jgi:diguanylate cyclase (GGDEF)-like protein/PAS domain S-box-containing protein